LLISTTPDQPIRCSKLQLSQIHLTQDSSSRRMQESTTTRAEEADGQTGHLISLAFLFFHLSALCCVLNGHLEHWEHSWTAPHIAHSWLVSPAAAAACFSATSAATITLDPHRIYTHLDTTDTYTRRVRPTSRGIMPCAHAWTRIIPLRRKGIGTSPANSF